MCIYDINRSRCSSECLFSKLLLGGVIFEVPAVSYLLNKNPIQLQLIHLRPLSQPVGSSGYHRDILTSRSTFLQEPFINIQHTHHWKMGSSFLFTSNIIKQIILSVSLRAGLNVTHLDVWPMFCWRMTCKLLVLGMFYVWPSKNIQQKLVL